MSTATTPQQGAASSAESGSKDGQNETQQAQEIYKKALTFNVIAKYDPKINQLIHLSSYCVVYEWTSDDWEKLDYAGPIAIYSRNVTPLADGQLLTSKDVLKDDHYPYGLIILNRVKPENFTIGILGTKSLVPEDRDKGMVVERKEELVIVRDFKGDTFGLWLFNEKDREYLYKFLKFCIDN